MLLDKIDDILIFGVLLSQIIRWSVSRWPYSGFRRPPMYGDYEAQRHWMEITVNLPTDEWYKNTTNNDLQYWGLDYPPLTAYQSMALGYLAQWYDPKWVELNTSRGFESYEHKIFMRFTVIGLDVVCFYVPVILYWMLCSKPKKLRDKGIATGLTLLYPALILIDHAHFQYNCVCLGLTVAAIVSMMCNRDLIGAAFFTLALHYKQMALYYALPFFCYLLGSCFKMSFKQGIAKFLKLSTVVVVTSAICWAPFLSSYSTFMDVVTRLFPVSRGIFEDKVANTWCVLSVFIKFKKLFSMQTLLKMSAVSTVLAVLPSSIHLFRNPNLHTFRLALVNSSLAFFLFSYQVHEKSILFAGMAVLLLLEDYPAICCWFTYMSTYSLVPLLAKEGLIVPFLSLTTMFICGVLRAYSGMGLSLRDKLSTFKTFSLVLSIATSISLIYAMYNVKPPKNYPHLHTLVNCLYSYAHFVAFFLYFHWKQFTEKPYVLRKVKVTSKSKSD